MEELELNTEYLAPDQLNKLKLLRHKLLIHAKRLTSHISINAPDAVVSLELSIIGRLTSELEDLYNEVRDSKGMSSTAPKA